MSFGIAPTAAPVTSSVPLMGGASSFGAPGLGTYQTVTDALQNGYGGSFTSLPYHQTNWTSTLPLKGKVWRAGYHLNYARGTPIFCVRNAAASLTGSETLASLAVVNWLLDCSINPEMSDDRMSDSDVCKAENMDAVLEKFSYVGIVRNILGLDAANSGYEPLNPRADRMFNIDSYGLSSVPNFFDANAACGDELYLVIGKHPSYTNTSRGTVAVRPDGVPCDRRNEEPIQIFGAIGRNVRAAQRGYDEPKFEGTFKDGDFQHPNKYIFVGTVKEVKRHPSHNDIVRAWRDDKALARLPLLSVQLGF